MFPRLSALKNFIDQHRELESLIALINTSSADYWLVGGCLRNFLLDLPQTDIDIACSIDPTILAKQWAAEVDGHWFWLDSNRCQSRVLLPSGLEIDFNPLKGSSIEKDLQLRDFTVNSLALLLDTSFPESQFLDPLSGVEHLKAKKLKMCSPESFSDDPLRILKGVRHAVSLGFEFESNTWRQLCGSVPLLVKIAGERIRDELWKILASDNVAKGVNILHESTILEILLGPPGHGWNLERDLDRIAELGLILRSYAEVDFPELELAGAISVREIILFAQLIRLYSPSGLQDLLHNRLRLSRHLQRITEALQQEPAPEFFSLIEKTDSQRREALLIEQLEPFSAIKIFYWGVCSGKLDLSRFKLLIASFTALQQFGRIPDLFNGKQIAAVLEGVFTKQIGYWQSQIKLAEINGEIRTSKEAEKWLKSKLSFDNKPV